jgi:dGTPase
VVSTAKSFLNNLDRILRGEYTNNLLDDIKSEYRNCIHNAKTLAANNVFNHPKKIEIEVGCYAIMSNLLNSFCFAIQDKIENNEMCFKSKRIIDLLGVNVPTVNTRLYDGIQTALDYICGMTDYFATHISQKIIGINLNISSYSRFG